MAKDNPIRLKTLKEQIYDYLRMQLKTGEIQPGSIINIEQTCKKLGISKSPLRDTLLQLEMEGFVTILPRRGVVVNSLSLEDVKNFFQVIGSLESAAILASKDFIKITDIRKMRKLNSIMRKAVETDNPKLYLSKNIEFHNIWINLCQNSLLQKTVFTMKKRLYDFTWPDKFIKEWEELLVNEHEKLIDELYK